MLYILAWSRSYQAARETSSITMLQLLPFSLLCTHCFLVMAICIYSSGISVTIIACARNLCNFFNYQVAWTSGKRTAMSPDWVIYLTHGREEYCSCWSISWKSTSEVSCVTVGCIFRHVSKVQLRQHMFSRFTKRFSRSRHDVVQCHAS